MHGPPQSPWIPFQVRPVLASGIRRFAAGTPDPDIATENAGTLTSRPAHDLSSVVVRVPDTWTTHHGLRR